MSYTYHPKVQICKRGVRHENDIVTNVETAETLSILDHNHV